MRRQTFGATVGSDQDIANGRAAVIKMHDHPAIGRFFVTSESLVEVNHVVEVTRQDLARRDPADRAVAPQGQDEELGQIDMH